MSSKLNIYACSGVGGVTPQSVAQNIENSGWERNATLRKYLGTSKDGGCAEYFLYIFIPERDLSKYNYTIYKKREKQLKTFDYVKELFVGYNYGTEQDMMNIIRGGIEKTFGASVEVVLDEIRAGKREGVGGEPVTMAVATIIAAVISLVTTIIAGIIEYCKNVKIAKLTAPSYQDVVDSAPAPDDMGVKGKKTGSKGLWLAALAGAALLIFGKSSN